MAKPEESQSVAQAWQAATWAGARREELRRWAELPLEDILRAQEEMQIMAHMFGEASDQGPRSASDPAGAQVREPGGRYQRDSGANALPLPGCTPIPLAGYLKALGVLRLVAEQADPEARGYWEDEQFVLETQLDAEGLRRFFLEGYRPTPLLAPWGARSGFYSGSAESGARKVLESIEATEDDRLAFFRQAIDEIRGLLARHGFESKPADDHSKLALMRLCRAELGDKLIQWLDACYTLTAEWRRFPPLLGTGGNEGSGSYLAGFGQLVVECLSERNCDSALEAALFQGTVPNADSNQVPGQFAPSMAGGANQGPGFSGEVTTNPWDYLMALEGTLLFASASTRRLESQGSGSASFPFTVETTGSGSGAAASVDEEGARAEMWLPLWEAPASYEELLALLGEGRVTLGRRPVRDGLDFARAVAHLGADRGISAFQRYSFIQRFGRNVFAVPLNRITVQRNPAADLVDELDSRESGYWLGRFRSHARNEGANRVLSLARRLEDAVFELATNRDDPGPAVRRLLNVLGEIHLYLARSPKAREKCPPVPSLSSRWLEQADDGSAEMVLAATLAGLHADAGGGRWALPMRGHLAPEQAGRYPGWATGDTADHAVTWHAGGAATANLAATLHRRLIQAERAELPDKPLRGARLAPLADVARWLAGGLDEQRLAALLPGLMLVRGGGGVRPAGREAPLPIAYRLLKPLFSTDEQLRRTGLLLPEASLPLPAGLIRRLEVNDVAEALEQGRRRLWAGGVRLRLPEVAPGTANGRRLLAALLVPVSDGALRSLLDDCLRPHDQTAHTETAE